MAGVRFSRGTLKLRPPAAGRKEGNRRSGAGSYGAAVEPPPLKIEDATITMLMPLSLHRGGDLGESFNLGK